MKAHEWAAKFRACNTVDEKCDVLDEFIDETIALCNKRKNDSGVREQKQRWRAMRLYDDDVFDSAMGLVCINARGEPVRQVTDKEVLKLLKSLE